MATICNSSHCENDAEIHLCGDCYDKIQHFWEGNTKPKNWAEAKQESRAIYDLNRLLSLYKEPVTVAGLANCVAFLEHVGKLPKDINDLQLNEAFEEFLSK